MCVFVYLVVASHHVTQAEVVLRDVISAGAELSSVGAELHVSLPDHIPELPQHRLQLVTPTHTCLTLMVRTFIDIMHSLVPNPNLKGSLGNFAIFAETVTNVLTVVHETGNLWNHQVPLAPPSAPSGICKNPPRLTEKNLMFLLLTFSPDILE